MPRLNTSANNYYIANTAKVAVFISVFGAQVNNILA